MGSKNFSVDKILDEVFNLQTDRVLLYSQDIPDDFFDLKTGVAGEVMQKLVQYKVRTAIVIDSSLELSDRFKELILESKRHNTLRFFFDEDEAKRWLG